MLYFYFKKCKYTLLTSLFALLSHFQVSLKIFTLVVPQEKYFCIRLCLYVEKSHKYNFVLVNFIDIRLRKIGDFFKIKIKIYVTFRAIPIVIHTQKSFLCIKTVISIGIAAIFILGLFPYNTPLCSHSEFDFQQMKCENVWKKIFFQILFSVFQ